jgi:hypothetical protein
MCIVKPGDTEHSLLFRRMKSRGPDRMPPLARGESDRAALALFSEWIERIPTGRISDEPVPPRFSQRRGNRAGVVLLVTFVLGICTEWARRSAGRVGSQAALSD